MSAEFWVIITAILAAVTCGWIGSFLVLRQNSMLGDAISHAVLPGLVVGFLLTSSRAVIPMVIGAAAMGLLTAYLTEVLKRSGRVYGDAALTVTFTLLFAIGVILVSAYTGQIDLDQECVLYGEIAYVPWDRLIMGTADLGPRPVWILSAALVLNVLFVLLFYKQLKITSFDPQMAQAVGISPRRWHYLLMAMVSLTVVAAFELVGAILVVAMLIIPGAVATLLTHRLPLVLALTVVVGAVSAVGGYYAASVFDASIAGFMAVVGGIVFILAAFGSRVLARLQT
jgi:manganese/zinc/iron transport system permease protein